MGDATAHYLNLVTLGRDEFLASAASAALVRVRHEGELPGGSATTLTLDQDESDTIEHTLPLGSEYGVPAAPSFEIYPLAKKPGASFPDRITVGRTPNNDIVITDQSISRLHAYVKTEGAKWVVADAGSKNGSWLEKSTLEARRERILTSKMTIRLGDVDLQFLLARDLYAALGGR